MAVVHKLGNKAVGSTSTRLVQPAGRCRVSAFKCQSSANGNADMQAQPRSGAAIGAPAAHMNACRRELLSAAALAPLLEALLPRSAAAADAAATATGQQTFATLSDVLLAYAFTYPTSTQSGRPIKMLVTHEPEKYSSAPPLSADARQRIVAELFSVLDTVTVTVSVGPAAGVLKGQPIESWKPYDVAETVLIDRSTARLTTGQRTALNEVEQVRKEERDGAPYWVYEHVSQGSPTVVQLSTKETYRHSLAVTAVRASTVDGTPFLYTLNLACPQALWPEMESGFKAAVDSFRLTPPGRDFIDPQQNPWLFF